VATTGRIVQLSVSAGGVPKRAVEQARVTRLGLEGDAHQNEKHHGGPERAVCLFSLEAIRALAAEIVREKVLETTGEELPYVTAVVTEKWEDVRADFTRIHCAIFVERGSQKKIIIGHGAQHLKQIGMRARHDIEKLLGHRCHLELFVKVEEDWRDREHLLDEMGIKR